MAQIPDVGGPGGGGRTPGYGTVPFGNPGGGADGGNQTFLRRDKKDKFEKNTTSGAGTASSNILEANKRPMLETIRTPIKTRVAATGEATLAIGNDRFILSPEEYKVFQGGKGAVTDNVKQALAARDKHRGDVRILQEAEKKRRGEEIEAELAPEEAERRGIDFLDETQLDEEISRILETIELPTDEKKRLRKEALTAGMMRSIGITNIEQAKALDRVRQKAIQLANIQTVGREVKQNRIGLGAGALKFVKKIGIGFVGGIAGSISIGELKRQSQEAEGIVSTAETNLDDIIGFVDEGDMSEQQAIEEFAKTIGEMRKVEKSLKKRSIYPNSLTEVDEPLIEVSNFFANLEARQSALIRAINKQRAMEGGFTPQRAEEIANIR